MGLSDEHERRTCQTGLSEWLARVFYPHFYKSSLIGQPDRVTKCFDGMIGWHEVKFTAVAEPTWTRTYTGLNETLCTASR